MKRLLRAVTAVSGCLGIPAVGFAQTMDCQTIANRLGPAGVRQCYLYQQEEQSGDEYTAAMGRAGLILLQEKAFRRAQESQATPDFSSYGMTEEEMRAAHVAPPKMAPRPLPKVLHKRRPSTTVA
jgi:hypothetical protein